MKKNTIVKLAELGITLEVSEEVIADITSADKFDVSYDDIKAMSKDERRALRKEAEEVMDAWYYEDKANKALYESASACYWTINAVDDDEYREENMAEFKAYEAKMGEPDFDWDFYSDWHKDMFGYRPHFEVIPQTEEAREQLFHAFHEARWL